MPWGRPSPKSWSFRRLNVANGEMNESGTSEVCASKPK